MIAWAMLYATIVGLPILLAVLVGSAILQRHGRAERGAWLAALVLALALPVFILASPAEPAPALDVPVVETGLIGLPAVVTVPAPPAVAVPIARSTVGVDEILVGLWILASLILVLRWIVATVRLGKLTRSWRTDTLDGVPVSLTRDLGPAVSGVLRPRILVPSWLVTMPQPQRSLVLLHEAEHIRARDPVLLFLSRLARVMAPWNPVVWMLSSRLIRAIELDCDRRVLRRHPDVAAYGATLLSVSSRTPHGLAPAIAFSQSEAPLRQRILAMTMPPRTVSVAGILSALVLGVLLLIGVFEVPIPALRLQVDLEPPAPLVTATDPSDRTEDAAESSEHEAEAAARLRLMQEQLRALEVSRAEALRRAEAAEARVRELSASARVTEPDGTKQGPEETAGRLSAAHAGTITGTIRDARSNRPLEHVQVSVVGTGIGSLTNAMGRFLIIGVPAGEHQLATDFIGHQGVVRNVTVEPGRSVSLDVQLSETAVAVPGVIAQVPALEGSDRPPLVFVDGVRVASPSGLGRSWLDGFDPEDVDRVEIIKGPAAVGLYGEEASGGVVQIFLKSDAGSSTPPRARSSSGGPVFTPFTVAPRVLNRDEVQRAMAEAYPPQLRDAGIGGTVRVYFYVDEDGVTQEYRIDESSGNPALDEAALSVADVYRFSPALNRDQRVPVWVVFPITFLQVG